MATNQHFDFRNSAPQFSRVSERAECMNTEYFKDIETLIHTVDTLRQRANKSAKQWRLDCRQAHAIQKRIAKRTARLTALRGTSDTTANWSYNPSDLRVSSTRRDNRAFRVCDLTRAQLDADSPAFIRLGGGAETAIQERYKTDKTVLDKQASKRSKN
jgi:hypothetical protein